MAILLGVLLGPGGLGSGAVAAEVGKELTDVPSQSVGAPSQRTAWKARIVRPQKLLVGLHLPVDDLTVVLVPSGGRLKTIVTLIGAFRRPGWALSVGSSVLVKNDAQSPNFRFYALLKGPENEIVFLATAPDGKRETERVLIEAPDVEATQLNRPWGDLVASVGVNRLSYSQSIFGAYSSVTSLLRVDYSTPGGSSPLGFAASFWGTVMDLSASPAAYGPEVFGAKADLTYMFPALPHRRLRWIGLVGASYLTLVSNGAPFGFSNLLGPEIGGRGVLSIGPDDSLVAEGRFVDVSSGLFGLSEHGLELTLGWTTRLSNAHRLEVDFGLSDTVFDASPSTQIDIELMSLRVGYSF